MLTYAFFGHCSILGEFQEFPPDVNLVCSSGKLGCQIFRKDSLRWLCYVDGISCYPSGHNVDVWLYVIQPLVFGDCSQHRKYG